MSLTIIQIGAHKGYDDLTDIVKSYNPNEIDKLILIEPQKEFNNHLTDCYKDYNFIIENYIINDNKDEKKIKFYSCHEDKNKEISSINKEHLIKHNQFNFIENEFDCITLNEILVKYDIINLDILFIDAEGFDDKIIKSIDFEQFNINKIFYENLHINNDVISDFLMSKNYEIIKHTLSNGWSSEATKKPLG